MTDRDASLGRTRWVWAAIAAGAIFVVALVVGLPVADVARDDPMAECALKYPTRKADLAKARWTWLPPGWSCEFVGRPDGRVP